MYNLTWCRKLTCGLCALGVSLFFGTYEVSAEDYSMFQHVAEVSHNGMINGVKNVGDSGSIVNKEIGPLSYDELTSGSYCTSSATPCTNGSICTSGPTCTLNCTISGGDVCLTSGKYCTIAKDCTANAYCVLLTDGEANNSNQIMSAGLPVLGVGLLWCSMAGLASIKNRR